MCFGREEGSKRLLPAQNVEKGSQNGVHPLATRTSPGLAGGQFSFGNSHSIPRWDGSPRYSRSLLWSQRSSRPPSYFFQALCAPLVVF